MGTPVAREYLTDRDPYEGSYAVTPTEEAQTLETDGLRMTDDIIVAPIPEQYIVPTGTLNISSNGTHDVSYFERASVNVPPPPGYIVPAGTLEVTQNGTHDVTQYAEVDVAVASAVLQEKTATPTESEQTVEPDDGYDGLSSVAVEAIDAEYVGSGVTRRSALSVSGATVTAPAGYYEEAVSDTVDNATWSSGATYTENPALSVDYDTGEISASFDVTKNVKPLTASGYADKDHEIPVRVKGNVATQLFTLDETTYTPSGSAQIIPAGRLLVGDQTISPIAPPWYNMSSPMSFLGKDVELFKDNFYLEEFTLADTLFNGWTPSTTAKDIVASKTAGTFTATDLANYEYYIVWECGVDPVYTGTPTLKAHALLTRAYEVQQIYRRPSSWANIGAENFNGNVCGTVITQNFLRYYGTTTGSVTYSWNVSYGFYYTLTAATFSNTTAASPTITVKTPKLSARCSTTYMSTGNAGLVDQRNSKCWISAKVYRVKRNGIMRGFHEDQVDLINEPHTFKPISFTIAGTTYQAALGSTWSEWVASAYNTAGATVSNDTIVIGSSTVQYSSADVAASATIVKGRAYTLS